MKESAKHFEELLKKKGLKFTYERRQIFEEVAKLNEHFDADSLYERFKKKGLRISRDTVYRTIPLLLESNVIQKSVGEGKREFFERTSRRGHHDHILCVRCGKIIEFTCDKIERLQDEICKKYDFRLTFHDHRLFGYCKNCQ
ncbi:MAG: transcriptional repressor [Candidatus Omnitrophica bacterium]|nr:transcriptional repressor [Candidatus Omnitrophota bacterium]